MNSTQKLIAVKIVHTIIWVLFVSVIFYILYCGISGNISSLTWIAVGLIIAEGLVLLMFKWYCPLTIIARKYSDSQKDNFDIYLPNWLARHNKTIFTTLFAAGLISVLIRTLGAQ